MKKLQFRGTSLDGIRRWPETVRRRVGQELRLVELGENPVHYRPMNAVGAGVIEIKIRDATGQYRVFYVARFEEAVYVLHAFEKKTKKTDDNDIEIGRRRYRELIEERSRKKK